MLLILSGCNIKIPMGAIGARDLGVVSTESGRHNCQPHTTCTVHVTDTFYDETFVANPINSYWEFSGWGKDINRDGVDFDGHEPEIQGYLCGGSIDPCRITTSGFAGSDPLLSILESEQDFYLVANFRHVPIPDVPVLKHEFRDIGEPYVVDYYGEIIGTLLYELDSGYEVKVNFEGIGVDYRIQLRTGYLPNGEYAETVGGAELYYLSPECVETEGVFQLASESTNYPSIARAGTDFNGNWYVPDPTQRGVYIEGIQAASNELSQIGMSARCNDSPASKTRGSRILLAPAILTDLKIHRPVRVVR